MGQFYVKGNMRTDKQRRNGTCPVYVRVGIKGKIIKIPLGIDGRAEEWDPQAGQFLEEGSGIRNTIIRKKVSLIEEFLWQQVAAGNEISTDLVRISFGNGNGTGFYALLEDCYRIQLRVVAPTTARHYRLVRKRLLEFDPAIGLHKVNQDLLVRFDAFLRSKGLGDGGLYTHHKILRVVLNYGVRRKILRENPYAYFKVRRDSPRHLTLSEQQVRAIQFLDIPQGKSTTTNTLGLTRDLFLFSCYTALRFSDIQKLNRSQLVGSSLFVRQSKTGLPVQIPLLDRSLQIITKYLSPDRERVFPYISNQTANKYLKDIAACCGIGLNLHFHLARHTFGSIMANSGMNVFALSRLMGHGSIKTTMMYVNHTLENVRDQMAQSSIFD